MPLYKWDATTGKQYSLLFVELRRPGLPRRIVVHYFAYNVRNGTAVTKDLGTTLGGWRAPTHGWVGPPGLYVHLLFEHEAGLAVNLSAAMRIAGSDAATDLTTFMATVGLDNATLVSINWMAVRGSILSRTSIGADRCVRRLPPAFLLFAQCNRAPIQRYGVAAGTTQAVRTFSKAGQRPQVHSICATCPSIPPAPPSGPRLRPRVA
jgi:hypothetical protein